MNPFDQFGASVGWAGPALPSPQAAPYYYGLEQAMVDSFKREAVAAASAHAGTPGVSAVAYLRAKGGRSSAVPYLSTDWISLGSSPLRQWWDGIAGEGREAEQNAGRWEFAAIVAFDRRYQPPQAVVYSHALSPAIVGPLRDLETRIGARLGCWPQEDEMNTHGAYVDAEGGSYPEVASRAVRSASQQHPSPAYGYFRAPVDGIAHQKIYLFSTLAEASGWLTGLVQAPAQLYDYAAVFAATDLSRPVPGLESFGHTMVSGDAHVGNAWPFLLGLPLGALGGYFYRGWQEKHPGRWIPGIAGDYGVGGPWVDLTGPYVGGPWVDLTGPYVGGPWVDLVGCAPYGEGPWVDLVGADRDARDQRRAWRQTRALIESAKREATDAQAMTPAAAWVWSMDPPGPSPSPGRVTEFAVTQLTPFSSVDQAQAYMFERSHTPHVALALFDTAAAGHWPNPVRWTKSDDPAYEPLIAQHVAQYAPGDRIGADPRALTIGTALDDVRRRAQTIANKRAGRVVGVIHTAKDNLWHAYAFRNEDDADDWLETATLDQAAYTYAAYYDKDDASWPHPVIDKVGGFRAARVSGALVGATRGETRGRSRSLVGAALNDIRAYAKSLATAKPGNAVGVHRSVNNAWSVFSFSSLDDAIDWLTALTADKTSFTYAAALEKGPDGTAYFQQEEFGVQPVTPIRRPIPRSIATTSGEHTWWT